MTGCSECQRCWQDGRTLQNGLYAHLLRPTGLSKTTGERTSCYPSPSWFLSASPKGGVAAECFRSSYGYLLLVRRPTATDVIALACDETRVVGDQKVHHPRHFFRSPHPTHRDLGSHVLDGLRSELVEQRRLDDGRCYAVHPHAVVDHLPCQRLGQADHPSLGDRVGDHVRVALLAGDRGHVDHHTSPPLAHARDRSPATVEGSCQVQLEHPLPILVGDLRERGVATGYACVVDHYIELTESVDGALDHRTDLLRLGDVHDRLYGLCSLFAQPVRGRHGAFFVDIRDHHSGAGPREALGDGEPYAPCAPGDDRDPLWQFQEHGQAPLRLIIR